ncbi:MAG TPA: glycosyltransferase [Pyrinomonadaceae bacterium]|jgi:glycosyltransferase involved in cell wall biosynthesis
MKRRVAIISDHASPLAALGGADAGGQNVYVANVARQLAAAGWEADVFTRRDAPGQPEIFEWTNGVRVIHVRAGRDAFVRKEELLDLMPEFYARTIRFFRERRYDLVHANFFLSGLVALGIKSETATPFAMTFHALGKVRRIHQNGADEFPDARFEIEERIAREADRIIAECPQDALDLGALYDAAPEKIALAPCGFDPSELYPVERAEARRALGFGQHEKIVLQLGRMVPRKGVETVVRAAARLIRERGISVKLVVVGGESSEADERKTPEIGRLKRIAAECGIAESVVFAGSRRRDELKFYYSAADVFASVPWYEPFGITPLEAMACGTPVVGARVGGIKYSVADGETGFLVAPRNPAELAEKIAVLLENEDLRRRFGASGISRVGRHFTWRKVTAQIIEIYEQILKEKQTRGGRQAEFIRWTGIAANSAPPNAARIAGNE